MSNSTFMPETIIEGIDEVLYSLEGLSAKAGNRVLFAGLRGALGVIAKRMKSDLDPKVKAARRWVGFKVKRRGKIEAKVGFGVGRKLSDMVKIAGKRKQGRPGVGISAINVHWWITGTEPRKRTSLKGAPPTGQMPAMQPGLAASAALAVAGQARQKAIVNASKQLDKEVRKLLSGAK